MDKLKNFLIIAGIVAAILLVTVLAIGFKVASAALVTVFYAALFVFGFVAVLYLVFKMKGRSGDNS